MCAHRDVLANGEAVDPIPVRAGSQRRSRGRPLSCAPVKVRSCRPSPTSATRAQLARGKCQSESAGAHVLSTSSSVAARRERRSRRKTSESSKWEWESASASASAAQRGPHRGVGGVAASDSYTPSSNWHQRAGTGSASRSRRPVLTYAAVRRRRPLSCTAVCKEGMPIRMRPDLEWRAGLSGKLVPHPASEYCEYCSAPAQLERHELVIAYQEAGDAGPVGHVTVKKPVRNLSNRLDRATNFFRGLVLDPQKCLPTKMEVDY